MLRDRRSVLSSPARRAGPHLFADGRAAESEDRGGRCGPAVFTGESRESVNMMESGNVGKSERKAGEGRFVRATMREIAGATGFSIATVSRALDHSPKIAPETRRMILAEARRRGYVSGSRAVALIVPSFSLSGYFGILIEQLAREFTLAGFLPEVIASGHLQLLEEQQFAGAVSVMAQDGLEAYWGERHIMPLVCINTSPRHLDGIYTVGSNDEQGMRLLFGHLYGLGHRRIGRLGGRYSFDNPANWNSFTRDRVFRELTMERGIPSDLCAVADGGDSQVAGIRNLLDRGVTAFLILNEGMEPAVLHALRILGCRVPEEISVAGWSLPGLGGSLTPELTALEQDFSGLARCGCELFRRLLSGEGPCEDILVDYHFQIRSSTALNRVK